MRRIVRCRRRNDGALGRRQVRWWTYMALKDLAAGMVTGNERVGGKIEVGFSES